MEGKTFLDPGLALLAPPLHQQARPHIAEDVGQPGAGSRLPHARRARFAQGDGFLRAALHLDGEEEEIERRRRTEDKLMLLGERPCLPAECFGASEIALGPGQHTGPPERLDAVGRWRLAVDGQRLHQPFVAFAQVAAQEPEDPQGAGQP